MFEFLLYSSMACADADTLMLKIKADQNLEPVLQVELIETVREALPECEYYWDAND